MRLVVQTIAALSAFFLASCEPAPETTNQDFDWQESVSDMRNALMGACSSEGILYAVGGRYESGALYRWTTRRWLQEATMLSGERLWSCWAGPRNLLLAVGQNGAIFRRDSEGWHRDEVPESVRGVDLYGVWGMPDGTAVAVGGGLSEPRATAVILQYDGEAWTRIAVPALETNTLRHVWASGPEDYWAVGDDGAIVHYNGTDWRPSSSGVADRLFGVYGSGPNDVYAVGGSGRGVILRWNGSSWQEFDQVPALLRGVTTSPNGPLIVSGDSGYVARYGREDGLPRPERITERAPFPHLRINTLVGLGSAVMGAASTMDQDDEAGDWLGSVVSQGRSFSGTLVESARPDAGVPSPADAGLEEADAGLPDAGAANAGP